jgi:hypothetical protein
MGPVIRSFVPVGSQHKTGMTEDGIAAGWAQVPKQTALAQLEKILSSPHFRASKRSSLLLRAAVEHAVNKEMDCLKERSLGVEVYDRDALYDTNQDPIVRTTAGEVRKRLAQYYLEPGHESELRISLPAGSYLPEVHPGPGAAQGPHQSLLVASLARKRLWIATASIALVAAGMLFWFGFRKTDLDRFWEPVIDAQAPALICLAQPKAYNFNRNTQHALDLWFEHPDGKAGAPAEIASVPLSEFVSVWDRYTGLGDAQALSRISSLFGANNKRFQVRGGKSVSLADLRGKPTVLIGAFSNQWTLSLTGESRYYLEVDHQIHAEVVRDRQHPENTAWKVENAWPLWRIPTDYAIITRVLNPTTEQTIVAAAGITHYGTQAAGELLTNPDYFAEVVKRSPRGWSRKNMQVVLSTKVLAGTAGPPVVMAVHFW